MTPSIDPSKIPDAAWELVETTPLYRRYICPIDEKGSYAQKTEYLHDNRLIADNQQLLHDSRTERFGDGKVIARIPLNVLYGSQSQLIAKIREGDDDHIKWWANSDAAKPYRTFRGNV